jgi:type IV secretory pathway VirB2 component (pilin)
LALLFLLFPFARSIEQQWQRRDQLFANPAVLPAFELITLVPPQTLAGATQGYASWDQALDQLQRQVAALTFDVALLGCGAYGLPLAAAIADSGRVAVHVGGALQLLFGIRGRRWEASPRFEQLMNPSWVRPSLAETPAGADQVDGRCYW